VARLFPDYLWYEIVRHALYVPLALYFQLRYYGQRNIPREGGFLMVSNHQSHLDPPIVGVGTPRKMSYVARSTLFDIKGLDWFMRSVGAFPINREGVGLAGIKESLRVLKNGSGLLMFPEGTRTPDGRLHAFHPGFSTLALRTRVPIVPTAISGAFDAWPRWQNFPRPHKIRVYYGPPILCDEVRRLDERGLVAEVHGRVQECLDKMRRMGRIA
jgi:1-acyl-sn-glycerol-3-phosphate acyltransferase